MQPPNPAPLPRPPWKKAPSLSQQVPLKVEVLSSPPLFENLVGGSTPCTKGGAHYGGGSWKKSLDGGGEGGGGKSK